MPDKLTKRILKFMAPKGAETRCSISEDWDSYADIPLSELCSSVEAGKGEILAAVDYLVTKGVARYWGLNSSKGRVNIAFTLKHEGLHYKEFRRLTAIERWKERIFGFVSGVAVTVIGGLILEWLSK
ncbi:hypothetical protein [Pseudoflavonifractor capillosus]|uniref:hypothetical protein n=1 Tax=Pseudoflavonifractor capillosus TaxID=106588 RepID=UPI00195EE740|nr:hypothetical protein [Pseudoflavonifractor capillosus]MBM6680058.1 hypothetical protein [Pseudoflavonifractor capillosus]